MIGKREENRKKVLALRTSGTAIHEIARQLNISVPYVKALIGDLRRAGEITEKIIVKEPKPKLLDSAITLFKQGLTINEVALRLKLSRDCVQSWCNKYKLKDEIYINRKLLRDTDQVAIYEKTLSGKSGDLRRVIMESYNANPKISIKTLAKMHNISRQTVYRHLKACGVDFSSQKQ